MPIGGGSKLRAGTQGSLRTLFTNVRSGLFAQVDAHRAHMVLALTKRVMDRTPVWEGEALVNWHWSVGSPQYVHRRPSPTPADPGHTGKSGPPPSGEPRREAQEAIVLADMAAALAAAKGQLVNLYLTNSSTTAVLLEYGQAPRASRSRSPGGVLRLAMAEIMAGMYE